jgi:hypothetical protein
VCVSLAPKNHVQTMACWNCGETRVSLYLALAIPSSKPPGNSQKVPEPPFKKISASSSQGVQYSGYCHFLITDFSLHFRARSDWQWRFAHQSRRRMLRYRRTRCGSLKATVDQSPCDETNSRTHGGWRSHRTSPVIPSEPPSLARPTPQGRAVAAEKGRSLWRVRASARSSRCYGAANWCRLARDRDGAYRA